MNEALIQYLAGTSHDTPSNLDAIEDLEDEVAGDSDDNAADKAAG